MSNYISHVCIYSQEWDIIMSNSCYSETSSFNTQLAIDLKCVELALIVQFFINTISFHKRLGRNFINGKTWNYCTRKELCAYFPYWNEHEIKRNLLTWEF